MNLLSNRSLLAVAAVVDVALYARSATVASKSLATRLHVPPRHLETLLQGLVQANILRGIRGPRGGYELARERNQITAGEIVRAALALSSADPAGIGDSSLLLKKVIEPRVRNAGDGFLANLDAITIEELCAAAIAEGILESNADPGA
jgi:Rrf2 family transcriptional regulator, iron-sulfur cluster assembly transcription factor